MGVGLCDQSYDGYNPHKCSFFLVPHFSGLLHAYSPVLKSSGSQSCPGEYGRKAGDCLRENCELKTVQGHLTVPFSEELPPFSATLLLCPLCGLQTSLLNSLKMRPFSFYHDKPEWARECINCLNWRGHGISETVKTSKTNDNLPYRQVLICVFMSGIYHSA